MIAGSATVIVGPAHADKRNFLIRAYLGTLQQSQASGQTGQALWLAPSRMSADVVHQQLTALSTNCLIEPGVATFASFADSMIASSERQVRPASNLQKRYLLQSTVEHVLQEHQLSYFQPVARTPGFLVQLGEWIGDKKRQDIWAEKFKKSAQSPRDRELALLYGEYQRLLAVGQLYDEEGRFWAARDILSSEPASNEKSYKHVVLYGFSDFTVAQLDILKLLAQRTRTLQIALTADSASSETTEDASRDMLFTRSRKTLQQLQGVLPQLEVETQARGSTLPKALRHAEQRIFADQSSSQTKPEGLEILAAASSRQELEMVVGRIKEMLFAGKAQPEDVAIVTRNLSALAPRLEQVLDDHGIPHWIESRPRLAGTALARTLQDLLRLRLEDWPFRLLLELIGNRTLKIFDEPASMRPRVCLEQTVRAAQIPSGKQRLIAQLERWSQSTSQSEDDPARQVVVARNLLEHLAAVLDALPSSAEIADWAEHLETVLRELGVLQEPQSKSLWQIVSRELFTLHLTQDWTREENAPIALGELLRLLQLIAEQTSLAPTHNSVGRVRVVSTETARHLTVPHLYLIDVGEQAFSSAAATGQLDAEPSRSTEQLLADQADMILLFYTLITRATATLTISYPAMDAKGQRLSPSPMVEELQRCFAPHEIRQTTQEPGMEPLDAQHPWSRSAHRMASVSQALQGRPQLLAGLVAESSSTGRTVLGGIGTIASRAKRDVFGEFEGLLTSEAAQADLSRRFDARHLWSPSQLEEYGSCPFRFFSNQLLKLRAPTDIAVANDVGRRGSILHQVLAEVHQKLATQQSQLPEEEASRDALAEQFRRALQEEIEARPLSGLEEALREIERREIDSWALRYADQEINYRRRWEELDQPPRPAYFEVRFGPEVASSAEESVSPLSQPIPFELDLGEQQIRITGQIDRIDVGRIGQLTVFNVIDYKSGRSEIIFKQEHLQTGKQLQLPLYALAAEELLLADQQAEAMSVGYWSVQKSGFEKSALNLKLPTGNGLEASAEWQQIREQLIATLRRLVQGVQQAQFPVFNAEEHCTSWCEYRTICRVGQIRSLEKQWPPVEEPSS